MTDIIMPRRSFITGLVGLVAAPAVVKASSLMQVKTIAQTDYLLNESWAARLVEFYSEPPILRLITTNRQSIPPIIVDLYNKIGKQYD